MTVDQLVIVLNWIVNFGIPIVVALITRTTAPVATKALVNLGLSLLSTAIIAVVVNLSTHRAIDWFSIVFAFVTGFVVSAASYGHLWKPTGVAAAAALRGITDGRHEAV